MTRHQVAIMVLCGLVPFVLLAATGRGRRGAEVQAETEVERVVTPVVDPEAIIPEVKHRDGALAGLVVYLSAGHGLKMHRGSRGFIAWDWQRPPKHGLTEDIFTADFVAMHLAPALERVGARVLTPRERDRSPSLVVVDDSDPGFSANGLGRMEWTGGALGGGGRVLETFSTATWRLQAVDEGERMVYARWVSGDDRDGAAQYTLTAAGVAQRTFVDQRVHGGDWHPIGEVSVLPGDEIVVSLEGSGAGKLSADAVRLGGGSYTIWDPQTDRMVTSPAWEVSALGHLTRVGLPENILTIPDGLEEVSDARIRARWATWTHPPGEEAVYISIHSDAGGGRGTTAFAGWLTPDKPQPAADSWTLANMVRNGVIAEARRIAPDWVDRGTKLGDLTEINGLDNPEIPSMLLELGFHDSKLDAAMLKDDHFQEAAARGAVEGLIRWRRGLREGPWEPHRVNRVVENPPTSLPPDPVAIAPDEGGLRWDPAPEGQPRGTANAWRVRERVGGRWGASEWVSEARWAPAPNAEKVEVSAWNPEGLSRASVWTRPSDEPPRVLTLEKAEAEPPPPTP